MTQTTDSQSAQAPEPKCACLERIGDNDNCPIHGKPSDKKAVKK